MFFGHVPHNKRSINVYHRTSNGFVPAKTEVQRKRNGHLPNTRNTNLLPHIFIVLAIENTSLYPPQNGVLGWYTVFSLSVIL